MAKLIVHFIRVLVIGFCLLASRPLLESDFFTFSDVQVFGTTRLSADDMIWGLGLKVDESTTREDLLRACDHLRQLKLFESVRCSEKIVGKSVSLTITVQDTQGGLPIVFDNFVGMTRAELLSRLKQEIPLFMAELPESSGLTSDIIRVLENVAAEHGITAHVMYDSSFWTIRGMNVFALIGISTPVATLEIEGQNAPSPEELQKWSQFYTKENFSDARLTWVIGWVIRDFYFTRGYLRPTVGKPVVQSLGEKDGIFPARVVVPISSGELYRFESVKFEGLAEPMSPSLSGEWKLMPGDPYDDSYTNSFIFRHILNASWAQHSKTQSDTAPYCAEVDEITQTVSVTIGVEAPKPIYRARKGKSCGGVTKFLEYPPVP